MGAVLAVLEQRNGELKPVSAEVVAAAVRLAGAAGLEVHAILVGPPGMELPGLAGVERTFVAANPAFERYQADAYADTIAAHARVLAYRAVLVAATAAGRDLAPRLAAALGAAFAADVVDLEWDEGPVLARPAYGGKLRCKVRARGEVLVASIRPKQFPAVDTVDGAGAADPLAVSDPSTRARTVEVRGGERAAQDVAEAAVVVSGGRGLQDPEHFVLVENLAAAFGGAVGASRAVVDVGWRDHAEQVGQTGRTVSPDLYIAVGISGAIQHLAGMRTAKTIVAINKDPEAPIFKIADYGIVGDLFEILPPLTEEVRRLRD